MGLDLLAQPLDVFAQAVRLEIPLDFKDLRLLAARVSIFFLFPTSSLILLGFRFAREALKAIGRRCRIAPTFQVSALLSCSQDHQSLRSHAAFFRSRRLHYDVQ
jgi:hypothetical protein